MLRPPSPSPRDVVLQTPLAGGLFLAALFNWGASPRPSGLGVTDYGSGVKSLGLCPATKNCISTAEAANDMNHYVPGWNYAPEDGRAMREQVSQSQAMAELKEVVMSTNPDKFTPTIVQETEDYLYVEYESPTFGVSASVPRSLGEREKRDGLAWQAATPTLQRV